VNPVWQFSIAPQELLMWLAPLLIVLALVLKFGSLRAWAGTTAVVTLVLIMLGAYVRLSDAGLGCPDWPGCYGKLSPTSAFAQIQAETAQRPDGPITMPKAWKEMLHRYLATIVGVLIVGMLCRTAMAKRRLTRATSLERSNKDLKRGAAQLGFMCLVLVVVLLQGLFGKWTVTLLLKPAVVTGHLLGGMLLFAMLVWTWQRQIEQPRYLDGEPMLHVKPWAWLGVGLLACQIALGGWTSTNYAALACSDLPLCQGSVFPPMNFEEGFQILRPLGMTSAGNFISVQALTAIHWAHRLGAFVLTLYLLWLGVKVARAGDRQMSAAIHGLLTVQILLGFSNVLFSLPLWVSVAHNGVAALLLGSLIVLNARIQAARLAV
jgi:heme a synthase